MTYLEQTVQFQDDGSATVERIIQEHLPTVPALIAALTEAAEGLDDPHVDSREQWEMGVIVVSGGRPMTTEEARTLAARRWMSWLTAKGTYERGLAEFGGTS